MSSLGLTASRISEAVRKASLELGGVDLGLGSVPVVRSRADSLRAAVEAAISKDDAEANGFWVELNALFEHGFQYWSKKQEFEAAAESRKRMVRGLLDQIDGVLAGAISKGGTAAAELERAAQEWSASAARIDRAATDVEGVSTIPGWGGAASGTYRLAAEVQVGAARELGGVTGSVAGALQHLSNFNTALFAKMSQELGDATHRVRQLPIVCSPGRYYQRTSGAIGVVQGALTGVSSAARGEPVAAAGRELDSRLHQSLAAPELLNEGDWPTGTAQADVPATDTNTIPMPDENEAPDTGDLENKSGAVPGLDR